MARDSPLKLLICPGEGAAALAAALAECLGAGFDVSAAGFAVDGASGAAGRIAQALTEIEAAALEDRPDAVLLDGDGEATLAAALVFSKLEVPLARLDAGANGSPDAALAERLCDLLLCRDEAALERLAAAGLGSKTQIAGPLEHDPGPTASAIASWLG